MSKVIKIKGSADRKFIKKSDEQRRLRKNIILDVDTHALLIDILIEIDETLKAFVAKAIEVELDVNVKTYTHLSFPGDTVNTTVFLPKDMIKSIKRQARRCRANENDVVVHSIISRILDLADMYPSIITDTQKNHLQNWI